MSAIRVHEPSNQEDDGAPDALRTVTDASAEARDQLSGAAASAGDAIDRANQSLRMRSDRSLGLVGAFSVGAACGLLFGGSNRLLIAVALVPAALVAGILIERFDEKG